MELELPEGEIHIWRADLDVGQETLNRLMVTLDTAEQSRAARFHFPRDRNYFIACRGILRELLGKYLGGSPAAVEFFYRAYGKPAHRPEDSRPPIRFNISHSGGIALLAFAHSREIGIDLEPIRPEFSGEEIAERYFSARELAELRALPPALRPEGFSHCWTRKEAYVKALGLGLQVALDSFSVSLTPGQPEVLQSEDSHRWSLHSFEPAPNFVAAIVEEGRDWNPRFWNWSILKK
jgi:4'-phosphopantetheinyl transferase